MIEETKDTREVKEAPTVMLKDLSFPEDREKRKQMLENMKANADLLYQQLMASQSVEEEKKKSR